MKRIAVFASGSGTNAENIYYHFLGTKTAKIALILTENPSAFVLERAKNLKIPSHVFTMAELRNGVVEELLSMESIDFIVLAGFLKLIPTPMVTRFKGRIVNVHPALLPMFGGKGMYGMNVHRAVVAAGEIETGITIHMVNEQYDEGDIVFQARCPVLPSDTAEGVANKVHALEYEYYPKIIESLL
ncbi:MAG: phosphoribosylglycinamide formyltransferase [Tenuifilaceae bacterium]|jgi:phosphoribosylglycinamide formyltransferase-1|nr:phosphoribosylglycinamide formyltransferase [Tenuifilaceae bacterium]